MLTVDFTRLDLPPGSRVLDLGCGDGRHVRATRVLPGVWGVGMDLGKEEVRRTRDSLLMLDGISPQEGGTHPDAGPWLVVRGDAYRIPFSDGAFDCLIVSEVLEHLHEDDRALCEIRRVLRPHGQLVVTVPRFGPEAVCWALSREYHTAEGGHVRIYRRRALLEKLARNGFRVLGTHFAHALHSPYWWLKCLVGPEKNDFPLVRWYHRFLVWEMFRRPRWTRSLEQVLNPLIGKSLVIYARKGEAS